MMIRCAVQRGNIGHRLRAREGFSGSTRFEGWNGLSEKFNRCIVLSEIQMNKYRNSLPSVVLYSSKPSHDKRAFTKQQEPSCGSSLTSKDGDVSTEKEAIDLFFEKRKAALAKQKERQELQRSGNSGRSDYAKIENGGTRPMSRNQNQQQNTRRQSYDFQHQQYQYPQQSFQPHGKRRRDRTGNNRFGRDNSRRRNNNDNNKNHASAFNNRRNSEGLSDVLKGMSRSHKESQNISHQQLSSKRLQRGPHQQNNQNYGRGNRWPQNSRDRTGNYGDSQNYHHPEGSLKLAEMMKKLRKDAPPNLQQERPEHALSARFSRHKRDNRASWRQKRFAIPLSEDGDQALRRRNNDRRLGRGSKPPQAEEFLQGRISRTDGSTNEINIDKTETATPEKIVTLPTSSSLSLTDVSSLFRVKVDDIKEKLNAMGVPVGDVLDIDMLELLAMDFGIETVRSTNEPIVVDTEQLLMQQRRSDIDIDTTSGASLIDSYPPRPPIVTIMGHVDHGKTTLMDALRRRSREQQKNGKKGRVSKSKKKKTKNSKDAKGVMARNVAGTEAGGITQIISAFQIALEGRNEKITFLDTPGHAAFRAMRQSGSHAADVIVLVVAADDGISEQTVEIIDFYKSIVKGSSDSGISMVVALNKIDKPGIEVEEAQMRIENQLLEHGIVSDGMSTDGSEYGQPVQVIPTSGKTGAGLDDLMEGLLLQSEIMDLKADDTANGEGIIIDARQEKGLGVVADCIVRWGMIEKGNVIISGDQVCQVRMLKDVNNEMIENGLPSQPVRIIGFKSLPKAGDPLIVVESEEIAEEMLQQRRTLEMSTSDRPDAPRSDVELHITGMRRGDTWRVKKFTNKAAIEESDGTVRIPIIVKADADGSLAAVRESLLKIGDDSEHAVVIDPIMEGIGEVTSSDIQMAKESEATIFSFGSIRVDQATMNLAELEGVSICSNNIIYSLLDEAKTVLGSYLPMIPREHVHGRAAVKAIFSIDTEDGEEKIAGLNVLNGNIYKSKAPLSGEGPSRTVALDSHFRIYRDGNLISPEDERITASSLRQFKEVVESVRLGEECGLGLSDFTDFEEGDEIECYSVEMKQAKL